MSTPRNCNPLLLYPFGFSHRHQILASGVLCLAFAAGSACGDGDGGTEPPRTYAVAIQQGDNQRALDGTAVPVAPVILVTDESGDPAGNLAVRFTVTAGGGSVSAGTHTNADGLAQVTRWTLGRLTGNDTGAANTLAAAVTGSHVTGNTVTFTARSWGNSWNDSLMTAHLARFGMATVAIDGKIYTTGGAQGNFFLGQSWVYDPPTNQWSEIAAHPYLPKEPAGAVLGGKMYVLGGVNWGSFVVTRTVEAYDPSLNQWVGRANMLSARASAGAAVIDGILYVVGGRDSLGTILNTLEAYDPGTNSWTPRAPMPTPRQLMGVGVLDGRLYVVGGENTQSTRLTTVETYNPATNSWSTGVPTSVGRRALGVAVVNGVLYAISGDEVPLQHWNTVEAYDPATGGWTPRHVFPWRCWHFGIAEVDGKIYTIGGEDESDDFDYAGIYQP